MSNSENKPTISREDTDKLEKSFQSCRHPDELTMSLLAAECGLGYDEVKKWFLDRYTLWRQEEGFAGHNSSIAERGAQLFYKKDGSTIFDEKLKAVNGK